MYWVLCKMCTIIIQCAMFLRVCAVCFKVWSASRDFMQHMSMTWDIIRCAMFLRVWAVCLQGRSASRDFMQYMFMT